MKNTVIYVINQAELEIKRKERQVVIYKEEVVVSIFFFKKVLRKQESITKGHLCTLYLKILPWLKAGLPPKLPSQAK